MQYKITDNILNVVLDDGSDFHCNLEGAEKMIRMLAMFLGRAALGAQPDIVAAVQSAVQQLKPKMPSWAEASTACNIPQFPDTVFLKGQSDGARKVYEYIARHFGH